MPKKLTLIPTLITLAISTLSQTVPAFAEQNEIYYVSDLVPLHTQYADDMAECGAYNRYDSDFIDCYNRITDDYRARYGGKFESMYQLDFNGRMVITGLNPAAGTVRLYIDETKAYRGDPFTFQNLVAFWADSSTDPSPDWDDDVAWDIVDAVLRGEEAPQGVHILYKGVRGEEGWITPNTEYRTTYTPSGDFTKDNNVVNFFFVLGYDTDGVKHIERNYYYECTNGFTEGNECRYYYTYDGVSAFRNYIETAATPEDTAIIESKNAAKEATKAATTEAENVAREATETAEISIAPISKIADLPNRIANASSSTKTIEKIVEKTVENPANNNTSTGSAISEQSTVTPEEHVDIPIAAGKEPEFPWWIIAFIFSGIVLILWWFIPTREK